MKDMDTQKYIDDSTEWLSFKYFIFHALVNEYYSDNVAACISKLFK